MKETGYATLKIGAMNSSYTVHFPAVLGFEPGDIVKISCYRRGDADKKLFVFIKRVLKLGIGRGCIVNKSSGLKKGDVIIARIDYVGNGGSYTDDTGVQVKEGFEDPFE